MSGFKWNKEDNRKMNKKEVTRKELEQIFKFNGNRESNRFIQNFYKI